jgi:hypothetical protein
VKSGLPIAALLPACAPCFRISTAMVGFATARGCSNVGPGDCGG